MVLYYVLSPSIINPLINPKVLIIPSILLIQFYEQSDYRICALWASGLLITQPIATGLTKENDEKKI